MASAWLHGRGEKLPRERAPCSQMERDVLIGYSGLQAEIGRPVMIGTALSQWESPAVHDLHEAGIRVYHRLDEIALILSLMYGYWRRRQHGC